MKLKNHVWRFPRRKKIADFRKNADNWKHWIIKQIETFLKQFGSIRPTSGGKG